LTVSDVLSYGLLLGIGVIYVALGFRRDWRGEGPIPYRTSSTGSEVAKVILNGLARTGPVAFLGFLAVATGVIVLQAIGEEGTLVLARGVWGLVGVGWLLLWGSAFLFNRPRHVVPPPLRSKPGAVAEWIDRDATHIQQPQSDDH